MDKWGTVTHRQRSVIGFGNRSKATEGRELDHCEVARRWLARRGIYPIDHAMLWLHSQDCAKLRTGGLCQCRPDIYVDGKLYPIPDSVFGN